MKKVFINFFALLLSISVAHAAGVTYTLDSAHTFVLWHIDHFGFSKQTGKLYANGTLVLDEGTPENSRVNAAIQTATVDTGNKDLDQHLQGDLFFSTGNYPLATFVSKKVIVKGKDRATVSGLLSIRGVAKPVSLEVKFNKSGDSVITDKETVGFTAITTIKRSDFGMTTLLPGLGDTVNLEIQAEAYKAS